MHTEQTESGMSGSSVLEVSAPSVSESSTDETAESGNASTIDPRILDLSYSSRNTLHSCPRKFQLYRLKAARNQEQNERKSIPFAYGHALGVGIQSLMAGADWDTCLFSMYCAWDFELWAEDEKNHKSFAECVHAVRQFEALRKAGYLDGYELYYHNSVPAIELSFRIALPSGFRYRGFVDVVLHNPSTGAVAILEVKHTGAKFVHEAMYKNSAQAIGYSIVLDSLFPELSEYSVYYLPYLTAKRAYEPMQFRKSYLQRALWIRELLLDVDVIQLFESAGVYPMHGEACFDYYQPCEYFDMCTMSTERLTEAYDEERDTDKTVYTVEVTIADLIDVQIQKESKS